MTRSALSKISDALPRYVLLSVIALAAVAASRPAAALMKTGESATDELGQFASTTSDTTLNWTQNDINNNAAGINALGLDNPGNSALDPVNHYLYVADQNNNRVLVYTLNSDNSISTASGGHTAQYVLGQTSLTAGSVNEGGGTTPSKSSLSGPADLVFDVANTRLFVADYNNNRVLVFNTSSISNGMNASYVLEFAGTFTDATCNDSQSGLCDPAALAYDSANTRLFVADQDDNRVMIFNVAPGSIANGENASNVLGQTGYSMNGHGHTQSTLNAPQALAYDPVNTRLFVADTSNNRVMIFNVNPSTISNGENASNVLGNTVFTSAGSGNCTQSTVNNPSGLAYNWNPANGGILFVADYVNTRVLAFKTAPAALSNGENASWVLGSTTYTSCGCANPPTQSSICFANFIMYDMGSNRLFAGEAFSGSSGDNRVIIFDGGVLPTWTPGYD